MAEHYTKNLIKTIKDYPKKGIQFKDIMPIFKDPVAFEQVIYKMVMDIKMDQIDGIVGIESRGFILASAIATSFFKPFIPIRKLGKLPPPKVSAEYDCEYAKGWIEMKKGHGRVLLVDDVLATGGTLRAAIGLAEKAGFEVSHVAVLLNLKKLNNFKFKGKQVRSAYVEG